MVITRQVSMSRCLAILAALWISLATVNAQDPSACLINWQYTVDTVNSRGVVASRTVDACVDSVPITMLNVFLYFTIWFLATWWILLSTQSC